MQAQELSKSIKTLVEKLANETDEARQSEMFSEFLKVSALFQNYSWGNQMMIWSHKPTATRVAGFRTWQKMNRFVKKGEKGIPIFAPMFFKDRKADDSGLVAEESTRIWFRVVYVFDLNQTDGEALPDLPTDCTGDAGSLPDRLIHFATSKGITVEFGKVDGSAKGYATRKGSQVVIDETLPQADRTAVLIHEISHCLLHFSPETRPNLMQRELEAESISFVVASHFGLNPESKFYLASYGVKADDLHNSFAVIQKTSAEIIKALEPMADDMAEAA